MDEVTEVEEEEVELTPEEEAAVEAIGDLLTGHGQLPGWNSDTIVYHGSSNRSIILSGVVDQRMADGVCSQIHQLSKEGDDPITVHINTPGGSVIDALAIYDLLRCVRAPIITIVNGACFSAGLIMVSAGDLRIATPKSAFFYHQPIMDSPDLFSTETVESAVQSYRWSQKHLDDVIRKRAGLSKKYWKKYFEGRVAKHFGSKRALKHGIIDEILEYADKPILELVRD